MLVTDDRLLAGRDAVELCRGAIRGGVTAVQLRLKQASGRSFLELARVLVAELPVPLIVNDRPDIAVAAAAAGAHLGPDDLPLVLARRVLPRPAILGASVGSPAEAELAAEADYWGIGPWRETRTKGDAGPAIGEAELARLVARSAGRPCVAIGGILPDDCPAVLRAGVVGVAVATGILGGEDVEARARSYAARL
jgi:thiamine-phosphate pyrophosphorylase